ncbi:unnamed protein product, partial [Adineta steineri]
NFPRPTPWNDESKFEIRLPLKVNPSRTTLNNGQIFNEKLNWNAKAKVHCWSESDLRQIGKKKSNFTVRQKTFFFSSNFSFIAISNSKTKESYDDKYQ